MGLKPGDLILSGQPFGFCLYSEERLKRCDFCFRSLEAKVHCLKCMYVLYCSRECQKKGWNIHKLECNILCKRPLSTLTRLLARIIYRIIIRKKKNAGEDARSITLTPQDESRDQHDAHQDQIRGYENEENHGIKVEMRGGSEADQEEYDVVFGKKRRWRDLMDRKHEIINFKDLISADYEEVVHDSEAMFAFSHIFWELEAIFHQELDVKEVIEFYGKVLVNSFAIQDEVMQPIGRAVYLGASIFDHSCYPNASFMFIGTTIYIKAIREMDKIDIQKIRISYLDELYPTSERIRQLFLHYYFICDCQRCNNPRFNMIDIMRDEDKELTEMCDDMESLWLDSVIALRTKRQLELKLGRGAGKSSFRLKDLIDTSCDHPVLESFFENEDQREKGLKLVQKINQNRKQILTLRNILSVRLADFISVLDEDVDLSLKIIDYFRAYYGRNHPRLALKLYLTGMIVRKKPSLKQRLLLEARNIASVFVPSFEQQIRKDNWMDLHHDDESRNDSEDDYHGVEDDHMGRRRHDVRHNNYSDGLMRSRGRVRPTLVDHHSLNHEPHHHHLHSNSDNNDQKSSSSSKGRSSSPAAVASGPAKAAGEDMKNFPTLISLIEKELKEVQEQIQANAAISNHKCKWRSHSSTRSSSSSSSSPSFTNPHLTMTSKPLLMSSSFGDHHSRHHHSRLSSLMTSNSSSLGSYGMNSSHGNIIRRPLLRLF